MRTFHGGPTRRQRRPAPTHRTSACLAWATHGAARRRDHGGHRPSLRARRVPSSARPPLLVPVLWGGDGHGLALVGHYDERHRRAETRARADVGRAWFTCLRRTRPPFA